jgi:hypothetical protein
MALIHLYKYKQKTYCPINRPVYSSAHFFLKGSHEFKINVKLKTTKYYEHHPLQCE